MRLPHRPSVQGAERSRALRHVGEPPKPHEPVRAVEIPELAEGRYPRRFMRLDEFSIEQIDENVSLPGT